MRQPQELELGELTAVVERIRDILYRDGHDPNLHRTTYSRNKLGAEDAADMLELIDGILVEHDLSPPDPDE